MATGPLVGGGTGGDGSREKQRWSENKVYTRKAHNKGLKKPLPQPQPSQILALATEDDVANSSQHQHQHQHQHQQQQQQQNQGLSHFDAASDDSSSLNRRPMPVTGSRDPPPTGNGSHRPNPAFTRVENRVTINLSSVSKHEMRELRRRLTDELERVRTLVKKLESREIELGYSGSHSQLSANDGATGKRANSEVASAGPRPMHHHQLSVSVVDNSQGAGSDTVEKEKRTPKANQYYRNTDFVLGKEKFPPPENNKKSKSYGNKIEEKNRIRAFRNCGDVLSKLMKHKHGWVFNEPVDVKLLGLHDYYTIIKHPMDLGTVKSRLSKNWYKSPREFAEDVRLTFRNAMTYNPKGQDVHVMAEQLLKIFEEKWAVILADYNSRIEMDLPSPYMAKRAPPPFLDRSESMSMSIPVDSKPKPVNFHPIGRTPVPKKPKAKDIYKRDMTYEEKQRLSTNLQSLPSEKLDNIVQIIKKRNSSLCQHDDEIEVDIDSVDTETLWELDRFVTNYKKSLSKNKRKAELALQARGEAVRNVQEMNLVPATAEAPKESKTDEKNVSSSSPVEGEKRGDNVSRSSSSSSSSSDSGSSSSDSDSESSSAGSDAAHSPRT